jgi:hypothetical protein
MRTNTRTLLNSRSSCVILAAVLAFSTQALSTAPADIKTPFQVVSLWSREMMDHLTGERQPACSGAATGANCQRLNTGTCDGTAYFAHLSKAVKPRLSAPASTRVTQKDAVRVYLPGREEIFSVEPGTVYTLSKTVKARAKGTNKPAVFRGGELLVIGVNGRTLEFRKEEEFDSVCSDAYDPPRSVRQPTYLAYVEEFYDADLHLQLQPAYPKGC